ncbi:MAG: MlaD family protein [Candidatus Omnitrophica bacterium]|nr:MlaD family protein [Candidatus Omnitrophota bacterium]MDD5653241.1 MlaD family protein [Candidatus Omnitrophota bacterium]
MIFGKTKLELKVGIFVFLGIIILAIFVLSIGKFRTWASGYKVNFTFNFVNGVKVGAPIRFAGVDVGEIKKITVKFLPEEQKSQVSLECWLRNFVHIPNDSTIWVNTLGLLGEKYLEIMPGKDYAHCMNPHESLAGVDPIPMHEVFRQAKGIFDSLSSVVDTVHKGEGNLGKFIYDDRLYNNVEAFSEDIRKNPWKLFFKGKER